MIWRKKPIYSVLILIWLLIMGWQVAEHTRVRRAAHATLINRAKDISDTLALVLRSQRRFNIISKERLESALNELIDAADVEMDLPKRQNMINKAVELIRDEVLVIPLHRQVIPWVSRANISVVHRSDNKFAPLWVRVQ